MVDKIKTKEEKMTSIRQIGIETNTEYDISAQAKAVIKNIDNFDEVHFKKWFKAHYMHVSGSHLHDYLIAPDGLVSIKKED